MECRTVRDRLLAEYPDRELGEVERTGVEDHLAGCVECREFQAALQKAAVMPFKEAGEIQPDEVVWQRIQEKLEAERERSDAWFGKLAGILSPVLRMPQPVFRVAFVTALVLVAVVLVRWPLGFVDPAYAYMEEQMAFMTELGTGNTEFLNGDLKEYDVALEEISR